MPISFAALSFLLGRKKKAKAKIGCLSTTKIVMDLRLFSVSVMCSVPFRDNRVRDHDSTRQRLRRAKLGISPGLR